jgi:hypothetical protein
VSAFTASYFIVFLVANVVASLPIAVVFQSPLIIGKMSEALSSLMCWKLVYYERLVMSTL